MSNRRPPISSINAEDKHQRRTQQSMTVRNKNRVEQINKRRTAAAEAGTMSDGSSPNNIPHAATLQTILDARNRLMSGDKELVFRATQDLRRLLSIEKSPPIQMVIDAGIVPMLVSFLNFDDNHPLQFESAWALTNIASGTSFHTRAVVDAGAVPHFVRLLSSTNEEVREQCAWALGNVAGDCMDCRDYVFSQNALPALLSIFDQNVRIPTMRNATWTLSNLYRGKPTPPLHLIKQVLPILGRLAHSMDLETVTDTCWALSYISDGPNDHIQAVLETGVAPRLVQLLSYTSVAVQTPALRTVGNIVTGNDSQTQVIINHGALTAITHLLVHEKKNIRKEACWTLSNIAAGTSEQIQAVMDSGAIPLLLDIMRSGDFEVQKEAAWTIANATTGGNQNQILEIVKQGAIPPMCSMLKAPDVRAIQVVLEGIENILKAARAVSDNTGEDVLGQVIDIFHTNDCVSIIEDLQNHEKEKIYERALSILETYFNGAEEMEPSATQTAPQDGNQFGFGFNNNNNNNNNNMQQGFGGFRF